LEISEKTHRQNQKSGGKKPAEANEKPVEMRKPREKNEGKPISSLMGWPNPIPL
jgi:hypothetical protein